MGKLSNWFFGTEDVEEEFAVESCCDIDAVNQIEDELHTT